MRVITTDKMATISCEGKTPERIELGRIQVIKNLPCGCKFITQSFETIAQLCLNTTSEMKIIYPQNMAVTLLLKHSVTTQKLQALNRPGSMLSLVNLEHSINHTAKLEGLHHKDGIQMKTVLAKVEQLADKIPISITTDQESPSYLTHLYTAIPAVIGLIWLFTLTIFAVDNHFRRQALAILISAQIQSTKARSVFEPTMVTFTEPENEVANAIYYMGYVSITLVVLVLVIKVLYKLCLKCSETGYNKCQACCPVSNTRTKAEIFLVGALWVICPQEKAPT
jgi:hypothetical protein